MAFCVFLTVTHRTIILSMVSTSMRLLSTNMTGSRIMAPWALQLWEPLPSALLFMMTSPDILFPMKESLCISISINVNHIWYIQEEPQIYIILCNVVTTLDNLLVCLPLFHMVLAWNALWNIVESHVMCKHF